MCEFKVKAFIIGIGEQIIGCNNHICLHDSMQRLGSENAVALQLGIPKENVVYVDSINSSNCEVDEKNNS